MKTAYIFPGQGSQYTGMGKDFYDNNELFREVIKVASESTGIDIAELCFKENDQLNKTEYTQIAMLSIEVAMWSLINQKCGNADVLAGLSLGEYAAVVASGAMTMKDAFKVVRARGIAMQNAVPEGGGMTAVIGLPTETVEIICGATEGMVSVANYNCPGQLVITGEKNAVDKVATACKSGGAKRVVPLNVSGPFHSEMLKPACKELQEVLDCVTMKNVMVPYVSSVTADYVRESDRIKHLLVKQIILPVKWQQTIERMIADGVTRFVEIGPGHSLTGFLKKMHVDVQMINIEAYEDLSNYLSCM